MKHAAIILWAFWALTGSSVLCLGGVAPEACHSGQSEPGHHNAACPQDPSGGAVSFPRAQRMSEKKLVDSARMPETYVPAVPPGFRPTASSACSCEACPADSVLDRTNANHPLLI